MYICNGVTEDCLHLDNDTHSCPDAVPHFPHDIIEEFICTDESFCYQAGRGVKCVKCGDQKDDDSQRDLEEKLAYSEEKFTMAERGMQSMSAVVANVWKLAQKMDGEAAAAIESGNAQIELNVAADRIRDAITFSDSEKVSLTFHNLKSQS